MGLVICIGGVLLLMLLVCGEEINTFGPLHLIVLHCTLLYYIALGGQVPPTWWHTLFVCQYNTGLKHAKCARALQCMSVSCVCSTVCVFAWCELHSGHNAPWQYSNTHGMTPIIPICCLVRSILHLKVAILSRNAHYPRTSTSSTLATLSGTLANTPNPNLPAYATL